MEKNVTFCKKALTLPPRTLFPPQGLTSIPQPQVQQPTAAQPAAPAGRPATPSTPQVGVPGQPSAVASLGGQTSTPQERGFNNTPTTQQSSKHQPAGGLAKASNALMGYGGTSPMTMPRIQMPMSTTMPVSQMTPGTLGKMGADLRVQLNSKCAFVGPYLVTGGGAGLGALSAPKGHGGEGALRGLGRAGGLLAGGGIGGLTGSLGGMGIGGALGGLAGAISGPEGLSQADRIRLGAITGGHLGSLLGLGAGTGLGAYKGYNLAGEYMGHSSYDKKDRKKTDKRDEGHEKKSFIDWMAQGAGLEGARAISHGHSPEVVKRRALRGMGHGFAGGLGSFIGGAGGGGLGAILGGLAGAIPPVALSAVTGNPVHEAIAAPAALAGAGLGGAAGAYLGGTHGGRIGYNLFREGRNEETDMAKADEDKERHHGA